MITADRAGAAITRRAVAVLLWFAALALSIGAYSLTNDHFGRISPARQIARYGELPFRDYFDPGYFLTEYSSAALQRLLGDNLLGELLLNTIFMATGALLVLRLVRRISASTLPGVCASLLTVLAVPRAYDYDKTLFYPLGLLAIWRAIERPGFARTLALALVIVIAGLYRYDNGVYIGVAALVGIAAVHGASRTALRDAGALVLACVLFTVPALIFLQTHGGVADALDQMLTYGARESARTRLTALPAITPGRWYSVVAPAPTRIVVRWSPQVSDTSREALETALALRDRMPDASRTWSYAIDDESEAHLRAIVNHPAVEDTGRIDRGAMRLERPPSLWARAQRRVPVLGIRLLPDFWEGENAGAILFYVLVALPIVAIVVLVRRRAAMAGTPEAARMASAAALCLVVDALILRDPIAARIGAVAATPVVIGAWLLQQMPARRTTRTVLRAAALVIVLVALKSLSVTGEWSRLIWPTVVSPARVSRAIAVLAQTPPNLDQVPAGRDAAAIAYVKRCTQPADRVFASWFFPELYWFAQRGFAGGMVVTFGHHWTEPRFQDRMVRAFTAQQPPIVLIEAATYGEFRDVYPMVDAFFTSHYRLGGSSSFGDDRPGLYRVLVPLDRAPVKVDQEWGLPCFA